ncbi:magnesium transporter [Kockiozyma suomiensis]|uniref:magnesium transporter n=1 Tax=Kockiozyma suomiensis TaxID=1337062 RepID=UPI00334363AC
MSALSNIITAISLLLLCHAGFSAYEFSHYLKHLTIKSNASLPIDIIVETLFSISLFGVGQVLAAPKLQPVSFAKWAKQMEKDGNSPFAYLERRPGFANIQKIRADYKDESKALK